MICIPPRQYAYDEDFEESKYELVLTPTAVTAAAKGEGDVAKEEGVAAKGGGDVANGGGVAANGEGVAAKGGGDAPHSTASAAISATGGSTLVGELPKTEEAWMQPCAVPQTGLTACLKAPDRLVN